ncbi:hypothetical protein [Actinoplanes palleronii]|uniref:Uncharacterized protein n=1 Tax=Actinoplanes palleronii TaxID=113570 RepID=A0ABQ4B2L4_9ACTN|nr:hypothetical protein [Actinoplanes palleronii]GIE64904.1 hypothetical protein Apa02nite_010120 [Actinoplanes palleronii]
MADAAAVIGDAVNGFFSRLTEAARDSGGSERPWSAGARTSPAPSDSSPESGSSRAGDSAGGRASAGGSGPAGPGRSGTATGGPGSSSAGSRAHGRQGWSTGSAECCRCPVCQAIAAVRDPSPQTIFRVATGAGDIATGAAGVLRGLASLAGAFQGERSRRAPKSPAGGATRHAPAPDAAWSAATRAGAPSSRPAAPVADESDTWAAATAAGARAAEADRARAKAEAEEAALVAAAEAAEIAAGLAAAHEAESGAQPAAGSQPAAERAGDRSRDPWAAATADSAREAAAARARAAAAEKAVAKAVADARRVAALRTTPETATHTGRPEVLGGTPASGAAAGEDQGGTTAGVRPDAAAVVRTQSGSDVWAAATAEAAADGAAPTRSVDHEWGASAPMGRDGEPGDGARDDDAV